MSLKIFFCLRAAQTNTKGLTSTQIADKLENDYDDYDDDVRDPDYEGDKESDADMYESDEVNLDVVRRQEQSQEEIRVYMDPPIERADGDTNKDSELNLIFGHI